MSFQLDLGSKALVLGLFIAGLVVALLFGGYALEQVSGGQLKASLSLLLLGFFGLFATTIIGLAVRDPNHSGTIIFLATILTSVVLVGAAYLALGELRVEWSLYIVGFISIVQGGAFGFLLVRRRTFMRLTLERNLGPELRALEGPFKVHSIAWFAIPIGALAGLLIGAFAQVSATKVVLIGVICVCALLVAAMTYFVFVGVAILTRDPTRTFGSPEEGQAMEVRIAGDGTSTFLEVWAPNVEPANEKSVTSGVDAACTASDIRKVFVTNQYQKLVVLAIALLGLVVASNRYIPTKWAVLGAIAAGLLFVQLPYTIGQLRTHGRLIYRLKGEERKRVQERLAKYAPVTPTAGSWVAFIGSGTLGSVAYDLLKNVIKGLTV